MLSTPKPYPTVANNVPAPDDAQIESRMPTVCVDYLSHQWTDEDVWSSWKAMTKQKNTIANGVRLENASWRTWAKQRGKLKTISPETLNWLKDSDVTWLYGPLHEHVESVPPPKQATTADRLDLDDGHSIRSILKHRTISDMLNHHGNSASPLVEKTALLEIDEEAEAALDEEAQRHKALFSVKSDSNLVGRSTKRIGSSPDATPLVSAQKDSPPTIGRSDSVTSDEKRHISFNHRVEQCISVDHQFDQYDDYDEDELEDDEASSEDDEVLTMKSSPRTSPASSHASAVKAFAEHHAIIAKIAPTRLKTSDAYPAPSPAVVDPTGFMATRANNNSTVSTYASAYGYASAGYPADHGDPTARGVQWDLDEDFHADFDYFNGPDLADNAGDHGTAPVYNTGDASSSPEGTRPYGSYFDHSGSERTDSASGSPQDLVTSASQNTAPRSILKHRVHQTSADDYESHSMVEADGDFNINSEAAESPESARGDDSRERGRPSQRIGSSASYERVQDATRQARVRTNSGTSQSHSPTMNNGSFDRLPSSASPSSPPSATRATFRGGKEATRDLGADSKASSSSKEAEGQDFASPNFPASPHLDSKDDSSNSSHDRDGDRYMYGEEKPYWSDDRSARGGKIASRAPGTPSSRTHGAGAKTTTANAEGGDLSLDIANIPSNAIRAPRSLDSTSPDGPVEVGPTPLNTPTFILARSSGKRRSTASEVTGGGPNSPTLPRRTSATGALVAPQSSDPRVPLAHDYVEEDEGGLIGRAVEIVNTARDLIGALLGTGDRGRSWREG